MIAAPPKAPEESARAYAARKHRAALDYRERHPGRPAQIVVDCAREAFEQAARWAAHHGGRS
ncbi:hypothetical protein [Methylobacterium gossipiicola]|uniref:Uncharacterized protein n=1 Tax=Methylobacterium gossipiicola TaxID=582675 RepID=A0A1I2VUD3_9HYPH|nr:hypothetical protein [Methylobacterium gossipiicola]SFG92742.1 hypothetical protein SAMN05192565_11786 [Methylobacterium gossipiicola]